MAYVQRGLSANQEQSQKDIIRDTRPLSTRIVDFLKTPTGVGYMLLTFAVVTLILGYLSEVLLVTGLCAFVFCVTRKFSLPFRMPQHANVTDYNDINPGTDKPRKSGGIYYFGNENKTQDELWFSNEDMRTHVLIFGSTGSGKTESMIGIAYNALLQASGFIYVDGKGDNGLYAKLFSMVRSMGRDDDMVLINFMTGARDIIGPQEKRLSNTLNPFARGSSSMLAQLVVSMMDSAASTPDGDMWKGRAISFVEALMKVLVAMRDAGYVRLDANTIRNYFHLPRLESMVVDKLFIRDNQESISLEGMPPTVMEPLNNYLLNLPGYNKEKKGKQVSQVLEQHGFITMQLTRSFTSLADTYGHIMRTQLAEVDLSDVVLNRRILCVLLPALEKAPDELSNLGKIIVSTLKAMMAAGLGDGVEGEYQDLVESKPTNAETPFLCILDEYGYYAVEGFAVVPAQARSLGFSVVFAGQDLPAFQKASKEEAASIGANTNIKICMKLEDPTETWDFFMKGAGESYVTHVDSFQVDQGSVLGNYQDSKGAKFEKRARIDLLDLKEQIPGEAHFFFKSKIVRGRFYYAAPTPVKSMRINHYLKVDAPEDAEVKKLSESFKSFDKVIHAEGELLNPQVGGEEVDELINSVQANQELPPIQRAAVALYNFQREAIAPPSFNLEEKFAAMAGLSDATPKDHLDVFTPLQMNDHLQGLVISDNLDTFRQRLLDRGVTRDQTEYVQRLCGKSSQQSMNIAIELIGDMDKGTKYPPETKPSMSGADLASGITKMLEKIGLKKKEDTEKKDKD